MESWGDVSGGTLAGQQLPHPLPEPIHAMRRLHSLDSINALVWPQSRRVSSAGSRASSHLHLYVDHASDLMHLYVDQPQLQQVLPPQPISFPRLRSTASINALVWPASRPPSSRSGGSDPTAVDELAEEVRGVSTAAALRPLPSAASIDSLLWPGDAPIEQPAAPSAEHSRVEFKSSAASLLPAVVTSPASVRSSATFRAQKQQSLLDRAAAKRALASLLAAAKASQIRGWSPRSRALSPLLSEKAEEPAAPVKALVGLPSLEDIEALVPLEEDR